MTLTAFSLTALLLVSPAVAHTVRLATPTNSALPATRGTTGRREIKLFVIALDDGGKSGKKIGCNDSLVSITREISPGRAPLRAALEELLRLPQQSGAAGGHLNALHQSKLKLRRVSVRRGEAAIHFSGLLTTGGVCDSPRVQAQIEETALQFPTVRRVKVYVNGITLAKYLSGRG